MVTEGDVRRVALALPQTKEQTSYGTPGFRVQDRLFARIREEGDLAVWLPDEAQKHELIASAPEVYFTTAHYDGYAIALVRLDAIDLDELTEVITEAWRARAPRRLLAELDH